MIKIATYNIHKAYSILHGSRVFELREAIEELDLDILFLQELQDKNIKKETTSQLDIIAGESLPYKIYGANVHYAHGHHGNAICSKYPLHLIDNKDISSHRFEHRGLLHALLQHPELGDIDLFCTHFGLFKKGRMKQANDIVEYIRKNSISTKIILAGDFNDWTQDVNRLLTGLLKFKNMPISNDKSDATFPSFKPFLLLDAVYVKGFDNLYGYVANDLKYKTLSDHLPIIAELS